MTEGSVIVGVGGRGVEFTKLPTLIEQDAPRVAAVDKKEELRV